MFRVTRITPVLLALVLGFSACSDPNDPRPALEIAAPFAELRVGIVMGLVAKDASGTEIPASQVTWSSSSPDVIAISDDGSVQGLRIGRSTIQAEYGEHTATLRITVVPSYSMRLLQTSAYEIHATGLNSFGYAVGWVDSVTANVTRPEALLWADGLAFSLGEGEAWDISENNEIVGMAGSDAVIWSEGHRLSIFSRPGGVARATSINTAGQIAVHWVPTGTGCTQCPADVLIGSVGSIKPVITGLPGGFPTALSDAGWLIGYFEKPGQPGQPYPFLHRDGQLVPLPPTDAPAIPTAINAAGFITGYGPQGQRLWAGDATAELPVPQGTTCLDTADGINEQGDVVGSFNCEAVLWKDGKMLNLQHLHGHNEWTVYRAVRINSNGQILALAMGSANSTRAVVLMEPL